MKKILTFLFGNLGILISAILMSVISWFLVLVFTDVLHSGQPFSVIVSWLLGIITAGFYLSAVFSSIGLIIKGSKEKKWYWIVSGAIVLMFDIVIVILNLV